MGCKLNGWIGLKHGIPLAERLEPHYNAQLERNDLSLVEFSGLLYAMKDYVSCGLGVNFEIIGFLEHINLSRKSYDAGITTLPLGYGYGYRYSSCGEESGFNGVGIDRLLVKNDDFLIIDETLAKKLTKTFCDENNNFVCDESCETKSELTHNGVFNKLYAGLLNDERRGKSNFKSKPLMMYCSAFNKNNELVGLESENGLGYDLELFLQENKDIFSEYFNSRIMRNEFFSVLSALRSMRIDWYFTRDNDTPDKFTLLTFKGSNDFFQVIEYIHDEGERSEFAGLLLKLKDDNTGVNFGKILKNSFFELEDLLKDYKNGKNHKMA